MKLGELASIMFSLFGILGFVAGAVAFLFAIRQRTTIQVLSDDNKARGDRMETLESLEKDCKERLEIYKVKLEKAEVNIKVLTDTITNAKAVADLLARVHALDSKIDVNFSHVLELLSRKRDSGA